MEVQLLKEQGGEDEILHRCKTLMCFAWFMMCAGHYYKTQKMLQNARVLDRCYS